jgi:hypothetical protein
MSSESTVGKISETLQEILATNEFSRSESMSRLLEHIVNRTLQGRSDTLKEYSLGVEVFRRGDDFDPRIDNIVRVQARNLRQRLAKYYSVPRIGVRIDLPTGSYIPVFVEIDSTSSPTVQTNDAQLEALSAKARFPWRLCLSTALIAASFGSLGGFFYARNFVASSRIDKLAETTTVVLSTVTPATGNPDEVRFAELVSRILRTRIAATPGLKIVETRSRTGFSVDGSVRLVGSRVALRLNLFGRGDLRDQSRRRSVLVEDEATEADSAAETLVGHIAQLIRNSLQEDPGKSLDWTIASPDFDVAKDFRTGENLASTAEWSYGWEHDLSGPFHPYFKPFNVKYWGVNVSGWSLSGEGPENGAHCCPFVAKNTSGQEIREQSVEIHANQVWFHPGPKGEFSVVRWKSRAIGRYAVEARFSALTSTSTDVHLVRNGVPIVEDLIDAPRMLSEVVIRNLFCNPDDNLDFVVGWGSDRNYDSDITGLDARIASFRETAR